MVAQALPPAQDAIIGLIGMGEMGKMYAERLSREGKCSRFVPFPPCPYSKELLRRALRNRILVCDLPEKYEQLKAYCQGAFSPSFVPLKLYHLEEQY
jgi:prephenate dehydrogenase (NADP+)